MSGGPEPGCTSTPSCNSVRSETEDTQVGGRRSAGCGQLDVVTSATGAASGASS